MHRKALATIAPGSVGTTLSRSRLGHHEIDLVAAALRADEPLAPIEDRRFGAVPGSDLSRVGLNLMLGGFAPDDEPHACRSGGAQDRPAPYRVGRFDRLGMLSGSSPPCSEVSNLQYLPLPCRS